MSHTTSRMMILLLWPFFFLSLRATAQVPAATSPVPLDVKPLTPAQAIALVGGPTLITLHVSGAPVPEVYATIIQQAGLTPVDTIHLGAAPDEKVTLDLNRVPFWKAVPLLAEQTHIGFTEQGPQSNQAILQPSFGGRNPLAGRVSGSSPFWVVAGSARRSSMGSVSYTEAGATVSQGRQDLVVFLTLLVDPKIHIVPDTTRLTVLEATDEAGKPLLDSVPTESDVNTDARYVVSVGVNLSPQAASRRVQRLRGILHILMVTKNEAWEVPALPGAAGAVKTLATAGGQAQLSVVSAQPETRGYRMSLSYQGPTLGLAFRPASALLFGTVRLTDSQGITVNGFAGSVRGSRAVGPNGSYTAELDFPFRGQGALTPPLKLSWSLPTALAPVDIPFEFTDLPLP